MGNVTRAERKMQRKASRKVLERKGGIVPIPLEKTKQHYSYWICGYFWDHDFILVEPFLANKIPVGWHISNLSKNDIEYYHASRILSGGGTMLIFEDRVMALDACEAIENQNTLLESFSTYMNEEQLLEHLKSKEV